MRLGMQQRWRVAASTVGVVLLLAACGGSDKDAATEGEPGLSPALSEIVATAETKRAGRKLGVDVCGLIEDTEVSELVGNPVQAGRAMGSMYCLWDTDELDQTSLSLTAFVKQEGARKMSEICRDMRAARDGTGAAPKNIADLGSEAWWAFSSASALNTGQLWTCDDDAVIGLTLAGGAEEEAMLEAARALTDRAFGRV